MPADRPDRSFDLGAPQRIHVVNVGGAGMSGLALLCHGLGATVTGSDRADSTYMERLRAAGLDPRVGHDAELVPADAEIVVHGREVDVDGTRDLIQRVGDGMREAGAA